ncbi:MAG: pilus assembly protein PilB [Geobacter sp.]|nr:pilus assembly protein PilB [Geobacter sp.]
MNEKLLGDILLEFNMVSEEQLAEAFATQKNSPDKGTLGQILMDLGYLKEHSLKKAIEQCQRRQRFIDVLLNYNFVSKDELDLAVDMSSSEKISLYKVLLNLDFLNFESLAKAISIYSGLPFIHLSGKLPNIKTGLAKSVISLNTAERKLVPVAFDGQKITIAMSRTLEANELLRIEDHLKYKVETVIAPEDEIVNTQNLYQAITTSEQASSTETTKRVHLQDSIQAIMAGDVDTPKNEKENAEIIESDSVLAKIVNKIIYDAWTKRASDIHIEPGEGKDDIIVRMRIDGCCEIYEQLPCKYKFSIPSRLKIMADLDISERRKPQDGKIAFKKYAPTDIELRMATMPTVGGMEDVVLRILANSEPVEFKNLGLTERNYREFTAAIHQPYGLILVVGPTGSGKTTTLHSAIATINTPKLKIWTAEDPVEITQKGLRQVQVNPRIGLTFAAALRSFLRLDPDVIMVGEMRDEETAAIAVESSLTGHLVFSTLHTNTAPETLTRLLDMGIDPFGFADSLLCILAQRLTRRLCDRCKEKYVPSENEWRELVAEYGEEDFAIQNIDREAVSMSRAKGCDHCNFSGYRGRLGIHELLTTSETLKTAIKTKSSTDDIRALAVGCGMTTLKQDGILKVMQGLTDISEVRRVCMK